LDFNKTIGEIMIYVVENTNLVNNNYITINRGDIVAGFDPDPGDIVILRIVKNERDF
jgi:hypothetical protein